MACIRHVCSVDPSSESVQSGGGTLFILKIFVLTSVISKLIVVSVIIM